MSKDIPGFSSPSASFDEPLKMFDACHRRMERQLATLQRLGRHVAAHGADQEARTAAANTIRYFDTAAVNHHADEEESLFPALLESMAGSDAVCLREITDGLSADHRQFERLWARLRPVLLGISEGTQTAIDPNDIDGFVQAYQRHLQREDSELMPMAERLLDANALAQIGSAMQQRRQMLDN